VKQTTGSAAADFHKPLGRIQDLISLSDFAGAAAALDEARTAGAPKEELQAYHAQLGLTPTITVAWKSPRRFSAHARFDAGCRRRLVQLRSRPPKNGRLDEALASYQEAARIAPDNAKPGATSVRSGSSAATTPRRNAPRAGRWH